MRCGHLKRDRVRRLAAVGAMLPTVVLLTTVRPVRAAAPELEVGRFGATFEATAISTEGDVGAGGGLVTFDTAAPKVTGRLDSGPSAAATAAVVEPGTLARTGAGQVNGGAGEKVIDLPLATASWPGSGNATYKLAERLEAGPLIVEPGRASATATATSAAAVARVDGLALSVSDSAATDLSSLVRIGDSVAEGAATAGDNANILTVTGTSRVGRATVAGVLELEGVASAARTGRTASGTHVAEASLTIAHATVAGISVVLTADGVRVATADLPTSAVGAATQQVTDALAAAGISAAITPATHRVVDRSAFADSGGVRITIRTDASPQVPGNTLTLVLGRVITTLSDDDLLPTQPTTDQEIGDDSPVGYTDQTAGPIRDEGSAPTTPTGGHGGARLVVAGTELPASLVVSAFGIWQLLSLSLLTLAAFATRQEESPDVR